MTLWWRNEIWKVSAADTAADGDELFERYLCLEFWGIQPTEKWLEILEKVKKREMRWEHTLTIRMIGRMTTFGSWTYWICYGQKCYKSPIISMGNMDKGKVYRKRWKWFGNGIAGNGPDMMKPDVERRILNGSMGMLGRTHGKLWGIWYYWHPMEWMIPYDGHGGSCSVWNGTKP